MINLIHKIIFLDLMNKNKKRFRKIDSLVFSKIKYSYNYRKKKEN